VNGQLIITLRITDVEMTKSDRSYQYLNYDGKKIGEIAPYVVYNITDIMTELIKLNPLEIYAYGYWGSPSVTAITPFERLCFGCFAIKKRRHDEIESPTKLNLNLPKEIISALDM
jgi:hypothetical protein